MIKDFFQIAYENIKTRKLRSWLTMIGIFIGIAMVVALISTGEGMQDAIEEQFSMIGADIINIQPGAGFMGGPEGTITLEEDDIDTIRNTRGVELVTGMLFTSAQVEFNDETEFTMVMGLATDPDSKELLEDSFTEVYRGRELKSNDKYKITIGYNYQTAGTVFEKPIGVRDSLLINGQKFKVVGILDKIGNPEDDKNIYMPLETYRELFDEPDKYDYIMARIKKGANPTTIADAITEELRNHRNVDKGKEDFTVQTMEDLMDSFNVILDIVQLVLVGIAAISLVVGGVGVMNTMYTAVLERTREIGVMKAVGARNSSITLLFVIEAGIYGLVGGAIGVTIGLLMSKGIELIATPIIGEGLLKVSLNFSLIGGAMLFSFLLGCMSGIAPAWQASRLKPVDSLRYE